MCPTIRIATIPTIQNYEATQEKGPGWFSYEAPRGVGDRQDQGETGRCPGIRVLHGATMNESEVRERYDIPSDVVLYDDPEDLPEGLEDGTAPSYKGSLVHGRCPECGNESAISVFGMGERSHCTGKGDEDPHTTIWELIPDE